eukprot:Transcript_18230.p1 GENE.Transcript_18230~~Transcript_18230.p1  ORF type:complete len:559 (-),score=92.28 Transcript_18230:26-1702(-)
MSFCTVSSQTSASKKFEQYEGEVAVGTKIYFAPLVQDVVGVLDTETSAFSSIEAHMEPMGLSCPCRYMGAEAVGTLVFFGPHNEDNVGVLDITTSTFSKIDTAVAGVVGDRKYSGAVSVGNKVYFTPFRQDNIGVLDTTNSTFSTINITVNDTQKYYGAAAVGTTVVFPPHNQHNVGVLETTTGQFSTIPIDIDPYGIGVFFGGLSKYAGAAALGTKVYMAPYNADDVGVFDVATLTFSTVRTVGLSTRSVMKFHGAAALGARVFFAPHLQDSIGVLDATTSTFSTITPAAGRVLNPETGGMSSSVSWFGRKYAGATVLGTNVYFTPYARCARHRTLDLTSSGASVLSRACGPIATAQDADAVGVLRTSEPPPAATNASCAVVLPADQNDPSRLPPSAPAHAALPSSSRPAASPPLEQLPPLLPPLLQIVLIPASIFLCASIAFGVYLQRVSRRSANLRRSRDRAQLDLQLLAHQVRVQMEPPCDDGQHSCEPSASIPSMPLSTLDPDEPPLPVARAGSRVRRRRAIRAYIHGARRLFLLSGSALVVVQYRCVLCRPS